MADEKTSNKQKQQLVQKRKEWADLTVAEMQSALHVKIEIKSKMFKTASDGLDIHITAANTPVVEKYLEDKKIRFEHTTNGNYKLLFPEELWVEKMNPKDKKKVFEFHRKEIIRVLANKGIHCQGHSNTSGQYKTNRVNDFLERSVIDVRMENKITRGQAHVILKKLFDGIPNTVVSTEGDVISITFASTFFQTKSETVSTVEPTIDDKEFAGLIVEETFEKLNKRGKMLKYILELFLFRILECLVTVLKARNMKIVELIEEGEEKLLVTKQLSTQDIRDRVLMPMIDEVAKDV